MEMLYALIFYGVFSLFALAGFPLMRRVTANVYLVLGFSKILGLIVFAYAIWLASSVGLLDYQDRWLIRFMFAGVLVVGASSVRQSKPVAALRNVMWLEGTTFALYALYLFVRSYHPSADGTEHFMDMAMLSASGKTHSFPFTDPWYAGKTVNYYYYGSYLISLISNLAAVPYALAYNLALGLVYSQAAVLSGVLAFVLTGMKRAAVVAGFLVTTAGTLFYGQCAIRGELSGMPCLYRSSTRLYDPSYIIHEIPSYSFTVGNLHAHVLALPFFLAGLGLIYVLAACATPTVALCLMVAVSFATSGMINSWDGITLFCLLGVLTLLKLYECRSDLRVAGLWVLTGLGSIAAVAILMFPALQHFEIPLLGVGLAPGFVLSHGLRNVQYPTPFGAVAGIWGAYLLMVLLVCSSRGRDVRNPQFLASVVAGSLAILIGIELFFIKDIYSLTNPPYFRANTTFKFGYQAWVLLSIAFAACVGAAVGKPGWLRTAALTLCIVVLTGGAVYPVEAVRQYYLSSKEGRELDASAWMKKDSGDWETVHYINGDLHERRVIAEAVGDSYSRHSRITTFTGMITPMGWQSHEWTWRFRSGEAAKAPPERIAELSWAPVSITAQDIASLYRTHDPAEATRLIDMYGIEYVYVGGLERASYPDLDESKFNVVGRVVFESHGSKLFAVR